MERTTIATSNRHTAHHGAHAGKDHPVQAGPNVGDMQAALHPPADPHPHAVTIQKLWRGAAVRSRLAEEMQRITPYASRPQFLLAGNLFSGEFHSATARIAAERGLNERTCQLAPQRREQAYRAYRSVGPMAFLPEEKQAGILHSFRQPNRCEATLSGRQAPRREDRVGNIYTPQVHDMLHNCSWMLGLAHQEFPVVLTARLDESILFRRGHGEPRLSALPREIFGLLRGGWYEAKAGDPNNVTLVPTAKAKTASLNALKTPQNMKLEEARAVLATHGIMVEKHAGDGPRVPSQSFRFSWWLTQLLAQDLDSNEADANRFPRLDTCLQSNLVLPGDVLQAVMRQRLGGPPEYRQRVAAFAMRAVEGVRDDADVRETFDGVFGIMSGMTEPALRERLVDCMLERIARMKDRNANKQLLHLLLSQVLRLELVDPAHDTGFPLLQRILASRIPMERYRYKKEMEDAMYSKVEITDWACKHVLSDIQSNTRPYQHKAMRLAMRLYDELNSEGHRAFALSAILNATRHLSSAQARIAWASVLLIKASAEQQEIRTLMYDRIGMNFAPEQCGASRNAERQPRELVALAIGMLDKIQDPQERKEALHALADALPQVAFGNGQLNVLFALCEHGQSHVKNHVKNLDAADLAAFASRLDRSIVAIADNIRKLGDAEAMRLLERCIASIPGLHKAEALREQWIAQAAGSST